jgi:hypothetical protein
VAEVSLTPCSFGDHDSRVPDYIDPHFGDVPPINKE